MDVHAESKVDGRGRIAVSDSAVLLSDVVPALDPITSNGVNSTGPSGFGVRRTQGG